MMSERAWNNVWRVAALVISIVSMNATNWYMGVSTQAGMTAAAAGGFFAGYAATGTLKSAVIGAFSAAITAGIARSGMNGYEQMAAQAVTGGVVESLQGGSFGHGFVAAGLTANFMPQVGGYSAPARTALGALIGGTISAVTGGKFANGAISGAVQGAMAKTRTVQGKGYPAYQNGKSTVTSDSEQLGILRLKQAQEDFYNLYRAGELPSEYGFLSDVENMELTNTLGVRPGLNEYLDAIYTDISSRVRYDAWGISVGALAFAPMNSAGEPLGPIRMWRGSMTSDRLSNLRVYAHEVLHRSPHFARAWVRSDSWAAASFVHDAMDYVTDQIKLPK